MFYDISMVILVGYVYDISMVILVGYVL